MRDLLCAKKKINKIMKKDISLHWFYKSKGGVIEACKAVQAPAYSQLRQF